MSRSIYLNFFTSKFIFFFLEAVTEKVQPTSIPFKQMQNVGYFVEACKKLNIPVTFLPDDLVYNKNMRDVYTTLEHLQQMAQEQGLLKEEEQQPKKKK